MRSFIKGLIAGVALSVLFKFLGHFLLLAVAVIIVGFLLSKNK